MVLRSITNVVDITSIMMSILLAFPYANAFVSPTTFVNTRAQISLNVVPFVDPSDILGAASSLLLSDDAEFVQTATAAMEGLPDTNSVLEAVPDAAKVLEAASSPAASIFEGAKNVITVVVGLIFAFAGITFITAAVIVPQAAKQLETETKRLRPDLWREYEAKLAPGETMAARPDLLQDLGNIMQPIIIADAERQAMNGPGAPADPVVSPEAPKTPPSTLSDIVDVEVTPVEKEKPIVSSGDQWDD